MEFCNLRGGRKAGLYHGEFRDNCGFGLLAQIEGKQSHALIRQSLDALNCMTHRGGINADGKTGDGCGILLQMPKEFVVKISIETFNHQLADKFALGMIFFSQDKHKREAMRVELELAIANVGLHLIGWRPVPVDSSCLGDIAKENEPVIYHLFVEDGEDIEVAEFRRKLFAIGRRAETLAWRNKDKDFYICSFSSTVLSYKGLMMPSDLASYYQDLCDVDMASAICVFHQRFSTNTLPQWHLAQPFRYLAHNGEINTISANRSNIEARSHEIYNSKLLSDALHDVEPLVRNDLSDSASLDQMLELLVLGDIDLLRGLRMMVPPAWENNPTMPEHHKAVHQYNSLFMEPWDGPAGLVITDGRYAVCMLDRNGLRPARWSLASDGVITLASETGVNLNPSVDIVEKGRVGPGQMIIIDTHTGKIFNEMDHDAHKSHKYAYHDWLAESVVPIDDLVVSIDTLEQSVEGQSLNCCRKMFALSQEEVDNSLIQIATSKLEPVGAMGDDVPMAVLSRTGRLLSDYLRQMFAQVTNPPIDPLREGVVMSLTTTIGIEQPIFYHGKLSNKNYTLSTPVLTPAVFKAVCSIPENEIINTTLSLNYKSNISLPQAIDNLQKQAEQAVRSGVGIIILSDRVLDQTKIPVHSLLATGAVHHHLVARSLRTQVNLIVESGYARDCHQIATLLGTGATAVYPWLAYQTIQQHVEMGSINLAAPLANDNFVEGINKGLLKIISKMGIACISSYRGAKLFEAVGLSTQVVDKCFPSMISRIGGADFDDLDKQQREQANNAWLAHKIPQYGGRHKWQHGGEYHAYNPDVVTNLRLAVTSGDKSLYRKFAEAVNTRPVTTLRDMLLFNSNRQSIDLNKVEPIENILSRFDSAAMSLGALSPEAHESLAQAMNQLGGRSNSGEGGEDPSRYGNDKQSKIKQVASGRFGVTAAYLVNAEVIQIKIAQGAKPGEGGQLPGGKVTEMIARLRYSVPGTTLISPPPHHDIYSIEDLAQLIFDLKQVNPNALVSVKLVSEPGIGTVASGVVKAYADLITVSGYDGGTAASPISSIHHAGSPWELGLSEVQQALRANGLRGRVRLQTDGGLKTGKDVVKAAMLGADSFGFGTAPMIAMGCKYLRICHLNNCATGVATQDDNLRSKHFIGTVDMVKNYFCFVAEEVREILASLGYSSLAEIIGKNNLLIQNTKTETVKQSKIELNDILVNVDSNEPLKNIDSSNPPYYLGKLNQKIFADCRSAIESGSGSSLEVKEYKISNSDRSCGATISGAIASKWGYQGFQEPIKLRMKGVAGQSFGVWNNAGLQMHLVGEANDYVGKGMSGGTLVIVPQEQRFCDFPIIGNTCLYGATGGTLFVSGHAGERFAVRNSGAQAVIEGAGDHCCEYMTGGVIVVLGKVGANFGAGMTGGYAYVFTEDKEDFISSCNTEFIAISDLVEQSSACTALHKLLKEYVEATSSKKGTKLLDNFDPNLFVIVHSKNIDVALISGLGRHVA